ncbi:Os03g0772750 [Oryza sativa Japonica Group]|uniref:Os03g0772750 protein n=1 Tax=Oryza sativa subsp. japonica TaxID=39947 RepID=A0A0P0W3U9_ORYSJ|nr:hypothetical protein EE612_020718 [Oryza sativa]BAS86604.1 Os03g0772750 [Oryza sativa Japonica Group]
MARRLVAQVPERAAGRVVPRRARGDGVQPVHVDADVVVVDVAELRRVHRVELHGEDAAARRVAVGGAVEEAQVLGRGGAGEVPRRGDGERDAVPGEVGERRHDAEHERRREGPDAAAAAAPVAEAERPSVERVALLAAAAG